MECAVGESMDPSNSDIILSTETVRADRRSLLLPLPNELLDMVPVPRAALHLPGNVPLHMRRVQPKTWRAMQREREANKPKEEASFARPLRAAANASPKSSKPKPAPAASSAAAAAASPGLLHATPSPVTRRMVPVCYADALPPAGTEHVLGGQLVESYLTLGAERSQERSHPNISRRASMPHAYKANHNHTNQATPSPAPSSRDPSPSLYPRTTTRHHSLPPAAARPSSSTTPPAKEDQLERAIRQLAARQSHSPTPRASHALRMLQTMQAEASASNLQQEQAK
jgi:hypothetical protein